MLTFLFKHSRPRFWFYPFGPYLIGIIAGAVLSGSVDHLSIVSYDSETIIIGILFGLYFLFPANIFIYGVNDIADKDTDKYNTKKGSYEEKLHNSSTTRLYAGITLSNIPFIVGTLLLFFITFSQQRAWLLILLISFIFTSFFYSCPPIRAKSKPILDGLFNILYIIPGLLGFIITHPTGDIIWTVFIAGWCWAMAMHAYSAIPDIDADKKAGLHTTAVLLGEKMTIGYCVVLYALAGLLTAISFGRGFLVIGIGYGLYILVAYLTKNIFGFYRFFPYINGIVGLGLFWWVVFFL